MTVPACSLLEKLDFEGMVDVRHAEYPHGLAERADYSHAVALTIRGEIEGVFSSNGRLKFLRLLPEGQRHPAPETAGNLRIFDTGNRKSTPGGILAQTNLGAYRQNLNVGWVWALRMANV